MNKVMLAVLALVILILVGGGMFLAFREMPPPVEKVEKVLPDARFPK